MAEELVLLAVLLGVAVSMLLTVAFRDLAEALRVHRETEQLLREVRSETKGLGRADWLYNGETHIPYCQRRGDAGCRGIVPNDLTDTGLCESCADREEDPYAND